MTTEEFTRLRTLQLSLQQGASHRAGICSKRAAKHPSVGRVYKDSRVVSETGLETQLNKPGYVKHSY